MTRVDLLEHLKEETVAAVADLILPVKRQEEDAEDPDPRAAEVHLMRLPDSRAAKKKAPYILHQFITGKEAQTPGTYLEATATVRTIFCVYNPDEEQGALALMGLMDRLEIDLLKKVVITGGYELDLEAGVETMSYTDDTAPYYAGEMVTVWKLPPVRREVRRW